MELLQSNLKAVQLKRKSDAVWRAHDSANHVLSAFRAQVEAGSLQLSECSACYTFNPRVLSPPKGATFEAHDWQADPKSVAYVLDVIRTSTGMRVEWSPGTLILLYLPKEERPCGEPAAVRHLGVAAEEPAKIPAPLGQQGLCYAGVPLGRVGLMDGLFSCVDSLHCSVEHPAPCSQAPAAPMTVRFSGTGTVTP